MQKIDNPETERIIFIPDKYGSNMSLKYNYSNIGFFSSARNRDVLKAMYRLGYNVQRDEELWMTSYSGTFFNYSIAGVKYYVTKDELNDDIYGFYLDEVFDGYYIYRNKNSFDIGYYISDNVEQSYNPFKMQNDFISNLSSDEFNDDENRDIENISNDAEAIERLREAKDYFQDIETASVLECKKDLVEEDEYTIFYRVKALRDCTIYIQSDYNLQLYVNGVSMFEDYSNIWSTETGVKQVKHLREGEEFEFKITTSQNLDLLYLFVSDNERIQNVLDSRNKRNSFKDVQIFSNGLSGNAFFEDDGMLCFAINYDEGWRVYVDGKEAEKVVICDAFLGVELEKGKHSVEIKFEAV